MIGSTKSEVEEEPVIESLPDGRADGPTGEDAGHKSEGKTASFKHRNIT